MNPRPFKNNTPSSNVASHAPELRPNRPRCGNLPVGIDGVAALVLVDQVRVGSE